MTIEYYQGCTLWDHINMITLGSPSKTFFPYGWLEVNGSVVQYWSEDTIRHCIFVIKNHELARDIHLNKFLLLQNELKQSLDPT